MQKTTFDQHLPPYYNSDKSDPPAYTALNSPLNSPVAAKEPERFEFCRSPMVVLNFFFVFIGGLMCIPFLDGGDNDMYVILASSGLGASVSACLGIFALMGLYCCKKGQGLSSYGFIGPFFQLGSSLSLLFLERKEDQLADFRIACTAGAFVAFVGALYVFYSCFCKKQAKDHQYNALPY